MKLCIDCADEIPENRLRLAPGTMRCVDCQGMHEVGWHEKRMRQSEYKPTKPNNGKANTKNDLSKTNILNFFKCSLCNYKKNQFIDRPCAWCGKSGSIKQNINEDNDSIELKQKSAGVGSDLYFKFLGGVGSVECKECNFSTSITSFSHSEFAKRKSSTTGYQCESCGKFAAKSFSSPFIEVDVNHSDLPLHKLPYEERPVRISRLLSLISICENGMATTPVHKWLSTWKETVDSCNNELAKIPADEIDKVKNLIKESNETYEASLKCDCGGILQRDSVIYCPKCKSHKLTYKRLSIT